MVDGSRLIRARRYAPLGGLLFGFLVSGIATSADNTQPISIVCNYVLQGKDYGNPLSSKPRLVSHTRYMLFDRAGGSWKLWSSSKKDDGSWSVLETQKTKSISVGEEEISVVEVEVGFAYISFSINRSSREYEWSYLVTNTGELEAHAAGTCEGAPVRKIPKRAF